MECFEISYFYFFPYQKIAVKYRFLTNHYFTISEIWNGIKKMRCMLENTSQRMLVRVPSCDHPDNTTVHIIRPHFLGSEFFPLYFNGHIFQ